jgi:hypothetical protein
MKTNKQILLAAALVLLASFGSAMAQGRMTQKGMTPPEPIGSVVQVNAIEVSDGTFGWNQAKDETMFGYSFLGRTTGAYPGSFTLSMNCTPAIPVPGKAGDISGGTWMLPVYMTEIRTGYAGSLYGTIAKGTMTWDAKGTSATIYIVLNVDGGTQVYDGTTGFATFTGTLLVDEKTEKTTLTGTLMFNTISPLPPME